LHGSGAFRTDKFGKLAEQGTFGGFLAATAITITRKWL
jgi:hypothetical protein